MRAEILDMIENENINQIIKVIPNADLSIVDYYGDSCLHIAVLNGNIEIVKLLIKYGTKVNIQNNKGSTPLHYAAEYGHTLIAEIILENGGKLDIEDNYGNEPLWTATFNDKGFGRRMDIVLLFLKYNANRNHQNSSAMSPVDMAQKARYDALLALLLT